MISVEEEFNKFQKEMWSHEKPLLFAAAIVEKLLLENKKLHHALLQTLEQNREEFIEDVRAKLDFGQFENGEN